MVDVLDLFDAEAWRVRAIATRYGVDVNGITLAPGCFALSCARWWIPVMGSHVSRTDFIGRVCEYVETDDALVIAFITTDVLFVDRVMCGEPIEFSVHFGGHDGRASGHELFEVSTVSRGAVPGTGILAIEPVTDPELAHWADRDDATRPPTVPVPVSRRRWPRFRRPAPPAPPVQITGEELRERYGRRRTDEDLLEFWAATAAQRVTTDSPAA